MWLTRAFIRRPTLVFVLIALTLLAAAMALQTLVVQQQPNSGLPAISLSVGYAGASTTELVTEIAEPLENQIAGTPYLDHVDTTIQTGQVNITAAFATTSSTTENIANMEKAVQAAQRQLPSTITPPSLRVSDPSEPVVVSLALVSSKYSEPVLASIANNSIAPVLEQVAGVSNVIVTGTTQPAFVVSVEPSLLAADNLTLTDVVGAITPNNVRLPGGIVYQSNHETQLDVRGDLPNPQAVANLPIHVAYSGTASAAASGGAGGGAAGGSATGVSGGGGTSAAAAIAAPAGAPGTSATAPRVAGYGSVPRANATPRRVSVAVIPSGASSTVAGTPAPLPTGQYSSGVASGASSTSTAATNGATTNGTAGTASSGNGYSAPAASTAGIGTTTTQTASSSVGSGASASANVPVDAPMAPQTISSNTTTSTTSGGAALPSGTATGYGSGAGTSMSPFLGALSPWAVPTADKRISDVATVTNGSVVQRVYSSQNGHPGVTLLVQKQSTASEVVVAQAILKALPQLRAQFPGVAFQIAHNQSIYTEQQVQGVEHTLIEGIVLTAIVMLFFLRSWRNAIVVMIAIPTSLGVTLFVMKLMNLTLDTISLMAMTLVIGILIDDSTVVLENVQRHHDDGEAPADAALRGRSEIGLAAIVITMVDVVVFLPIAFAGGQVGQLLSEFAIVITVATLTSLFVSFTITPTLAGLWSLRSSWKPWRPIVWFNDRFEALRGRYAERWLPAAVGRPWPIVIAAAIGCAAAWTLIPTGLVGEEFLPPADQGIATIQVVFPAGHPLAATETTMSRLEAAVRQMIARTDLQYETTTAGAFSAAFGGFVQEGNVGQITLYLQPNHKTPTQTYVRDLQRKLRPLAQGATVTVTAQQGQGGGSQQPIDELVSMADGSDPTPWAAKILAALQRTPGATGAQDSATNAAPQMEVRFDRARLQSLDVADGTAAQAVEAAFGGAVASQIETPDRGLTQILVMYPRSAQTSLADVLAIPIRAQNTQIVRLGDVAQLAYSPAPLLITRENRQTVIHVSANVAPGSNLSEVTKAFQQRVRALHLPRTVVMHPAAQGQQALMGQALRTLGGSLIISIVLVFLMIVALYNSYRTPFVTLFAIPVATIGALGALWITHQTLNLYSLIGTVLLVGLVTKNGILLVDYADTVRLREGKSRRDGMIDAARIRFRPIVMTTIAMVSGMLPLALGLEPGGAQRASLAIVVIGGLLSSLLLTLFIVPIMYQWLAPAELSHGVVFADERGPSPQPA
ncbi:MAG TPA: efflux RND transporter permease subunit [Candidatus Elarobacter sp.]